mmetsp:Transcript_18049/g.38537  ORF Transcript_18049/g.38537 Transcript_18049/m.38537 type:complete len:523 (-) Transcript_18049:13-1581(-)
MALSPVVPVGDAIVSVGQPTEGPNKLPVVSGRQVAWDRRSDEAALAQKGEGAALTLAQKAEGTLLVILSIVDNVLCYVTFFTVRKFSGRLYSIVDLNLALLPGLDTALIIFTVMGSLCFVMLILLVECCQLPLFHEIMNFRVYCSACPCAVICAILVYQLERAEWVPMATLTAILCLVFFWCLNMRVRWSHELNVMSKILLDISWFLALICAILLVTFYAFDCLNVITNSEELSCPYVENAKMPIKVHTLDQWYCAPFDAEKRTEVLRAPVSSTPSQLSCSDTFVYVFGASLEPHLIQCPIGCLRTYSGADVIGCGTYTVDSPICPAAIHAGVLTDQGGVATVYGRVGVPHFESCPRNSLLSLERRIAEAGSSVSLTTPAGGGFSSFTLPTGGGRRLAATLPYVATSTGVEIPPAFHFNNLESTREFLWLKQWNEVISEDPRVEDGKPWTRVEVNVSARLAGLELENEMVILGQHPYQPLFSTGTVSSVQCRVRASGVLCQGAGASMLQLDFCRPEVMSCPT